MVQGGLQVQVKEGLRYRGREGQWAWLLHRLTGIGVFLFLALHIFDIFLMSFGEEVFNELIFLYHQPWARVGHIFLFFGLLFHAFNGIRVTIMDFWPSLWRYQRQGIWIQTVIFLAVFIPSAIAILVELLGN